VKQKGRKKHKNKPEDANIIEALDRLDYIKINFKAEISKWKEFDFYISSSFESLEENGNELQLKVASWIDKVFNCCLDDEETLSKETLINHLIFMKRVSIETKPWDGKELTIELSSDVIQDYESSLLLDAEVLVLYANGRDLGLKRSNILKNFNDFLELEIGQTTVIESIKLFLKELKLSIYSFCISVCSIVKETADHLQQQLSGQLDVEIDAVKNEVARVIQNNFNFAFDFVKDSTRLLSGPLRKKLEKLQIQLSHTWMDYVLEYMERGKGTKPRWSTVGLNFITGFSSDLISSMTNDEYLEFKEKFNQFIDHLFGTRAKSKINITMHRKTSSNVYVKKYHANKETEESGKEYCDTKKNDDISSPMKRIRKSICLMENRRDNNRFEKRLIGHVIDCDNENSWSWKYFKTQIGYKSVSFKWQRGTKLGEGSFGQVYTCVNIDNGKLLAMKEVEFQTNNEQRIKEIISEVATLEGITHQNLVRFFGVEIHRDQICIFMEHCDAGTLEDIGNLGLPMRHIQDYTRQLLTAVQVLHQHGIIHRDIKGSNIFLTSSGLLKLGDFGSAIKLTNRSYTLPGEVFSHSGITAAYTAPEVINNVNKKGYGRSADVWSIGCVVIEMVSGKRPWHDLEPFQIMYKVGMGAKPTIPGSLISEGNEFVNKCLEINPEQRATVEQLIMNSFVRIGTSF